MPHFMNKGKRHTITTSPTPKRSQATPPQKEENMPTQPTQKNGLLSPNPKKSANNPPLPKSGSIG